MEKNLSNELFIVGVSLDCLSVGCVPDSPIANRLQALSGQVLSDSKKMEELELAASDLSFLRKQFHDFVLQAENQDMLDEHVEFFVTLLGARFVSILKND